MLIKTDEIVDLSAIQKLTEKHLEIHKKIRQHSTTLYGQEFPYGRCLGTRLVSLKDIKWRGGLYQIYQTRFLGGNPRHTDIKNSIHIQGLKLESPGLFLVEKSDGLYPLTGHTRYRIFEEIGLENVIATIYEIPEESDASAFALELNPRQDPAGPMTLYDVEQECKIAFKKGWIKPKSDDMTDVIESITERFYRICGAHFTKGAKDAAILRVYNNVGLEVDDVMSWQTRPQIETWMSKNKYINTKQVIYLVASASTVSTTITKAARLSSTNVGVEIRVVIHTGTLDSGNLLGSFNKRVNEFHSVWEEDIQNIRATFFTSTDEKAKVALADNIVLYGALPALAKHHNMDKIRLFKKQPTVIMNGGEE
jgi:hypothetical protein